MTSRLTIEYDGALFAGWAAQPGQRTVQAELERALEIVLRRAPGSVRLTVAGRTDRGVHALAQVASYDGEPAPVSALNALLPDDVAVLACGPAEPGFDARRHATSRAYCYRVLARAGRPALERGQMLHWGYPVDAGMLHACAALLPGTHDFTAFTPSDTYHVRFDREVLTARWDAVSSCIPGRVRQAGGLPAGQVDGRLLTFWIEADTFMRHMNRVLVGTMLDVARGHRTFESFAALLEGRPRADAGPTAPAHGLCLAGVGYRGHRVLSP